MAKQSNYYQPLRGYKDSYFPKQKFYAQIDNNLLIIYDDRCYFLDTNKLHLLLDFLQRDGIIPKILNEMPDIIIQKPGNKSNNFENFFNIINHKQTLIYIESAFGNWYKKDFGFYDHQQTKELIGHLKDNGAHEMDLFYHHHWF